MGVSTFIKLDSNISYSFKLTLSAIDGSLHEIPTAEGTISYVIAGTVNFTINKGKLIFNNYSIIDNVYEGSGEEFMRKMEYDLANSLNSDIILMDRKISMDKEKNMKIPKNTIGIVKDFDPKIRSKLNYNEYPWLLVNKENSDILSGYFKLNKYSWTFYFESNIIEPEKILQLLYICGEYPIPEALGYNYPLFLADKLVKYYRNKMEKAVDISKGKLLEYREFRSIIETSRARSEKNV
jgi:hypothetical protein